MTKREQITGNTYPVKDSLRAMGGRWDADSKAWSVPAERAAEARALVAAGPAPGTAPAEKRLFRHYKCVRCGKRPDGRGWPRIYRNGMCSDCYADARDDNR